MTPEEYIEKLKDAQRTLDMAKNDLDRAIQRMEKRLETGYSHMETKSRLAALVACDYMKLAGSEILETATSNIDY